ncbi:hypothetical protein [Nitrosospira briensis]|uniref:hypothetical protein n=1 Tax=Nitrosospira briensis TaxID=35799 RepID=UPI0008ED3196|nr:hypothetical protein [Nitrosospira briensis]SFO14262.1 hypothetical protein SAMN05216332_10611 [Nitrosospira briensis]
MPPEKTSSLGKLTDEQRDKVLTLVAEIALVKHVRKQRKEWDELKAARDKEKAGQAPTNSASEASPKQT